MRVTPSQVGFILFLLANATIYVRPWEILPELEGVQIYVVLILAAALFSYREIQHHLKWESLRAQPITLCVLGFLIAVAVSHLTNGWLGGAIRGFVMMAKTVVYYLVLVATVNSTRRFRAYLISLALCALFCIAISVLDYHQIVELESLTHVKERSGYTITGQDIFFFRLSGLGMFHDPNDMSLLIISTAILCLAQLNDIRWGWTRVFWLLPFPLLVVAMLDTHSRGGLLSAGAALMVFLTMKYGRKVAIAAILMGVCAAPLALGRMANIDVSEGTGQQRIRLWSEGFSAIQGPKVLFGIGEGMYVDISNYVAHNSYVHAFVELGLFGGTFFVGCFFFAAYGLYRLKVDGEKVYDEGLSFYFPYVAGIIAAWCMGMLSLSRCYPTPTYSIIGMAAALLNITGIYLYPIRPVLRLNYPLAKRWVASSMMVFVGMYVITRALARF